MKKLSLIFAAFVLSMTAFVVSSCDEKIETTIPVESIEITLPEQAEINMAIGDVQDIDAVVLPDEAENKAWGLVSNNEDVVSFVNNDGKWTIKAEAVGTATITVSAMANGNITDVLKVTVVEEPIPATKITITPNEGALVVGDELDFKVEIEPATATVRNYELKLDNEDLASIKHSRTIVAKKAGAVKLTATLGELKSEANFTITDQELTIAQFLQKEVNPDVYYQLTGVITNIDNDTYGNFTIKDETAEVYVYGLTATKSSKYELYEGKDYGKWSNDKSFASLELKEGDEVTLIGTRDMYFKDQSIQVGGAYHVSHVDADPGFFTIKVTEDEGSYSAEIRHNTDEERYYMFDVINEAKLNAAVAAKDIAEPKVASYVQNQIDNSIAELQEEYPDMPLAKIINGILEDNGKKGTKELTLAPLLGKNNVYAYTIDSLTGKVEGLSVNMYCNNTTVPKFSVEVVSSSAKDIIVNIDAPENLPTDEYGDKIDYLVRVVPASEIEGLSQTEIFQNELDFFAKRAAEDGGYYYPAVAEYYSYQWGEDATNFSVSRFGTIEENQEYAVLVYAVEMDTYYKTCYIQSNIAHVSTNTKVIEMNYDIEFEFGIDRVQVIDDVTYVFHSVTPNDLEQRYVFTMLGFEDPNYYVEEKPYDGLVIPLTPSMAKSILEEKVGGHYPEIEPVTGYAAAGEWDGMKVNSSEDLAKDPYANKYYVIAAAVDADNNICSEVFMNIYDVTGKTSTDRIMNMTVSPDGEARSFTVSVNPDNTSEENPYIYKVLTRDSIIRWYKDNGYEYMLSTASNAEIAELYVKEVVNAEFAKLEGSTEEKIAAYFEAEGEDAKTTAISSETLDITEDTYVIAYAFYLKSGSLNSVTSKLLEIPVPEAQDVNLLSSDNVELSFNSSTLSYQYNFNFSWNKGNIRFRNLDGEYDNVMGYTHTKHVILDKEYGPSGNGDIEKGMAEADKYTINYDYAYVTIDDGDNAEQVPVRTATIKFEEAGEDYTVTLDVVLDTKTKDHYKYTYTGALDETVINGTPYFEITAAQQTEGKFQGMWMGTITPATYDNYLLGSVSEMMLSMAFDEDMISAPTLDAFVNEYIVAGIKGNLTGDELTDAVWNALYESGTSGEQVLPIEMATPGNNYVFAFHLNAKAEVIGLTYTTFVVEGGAGGMDPLSL